jgi:hypothetical protein
MPECDARPFVREPMVDPHLYLDKREPSESFEADDTDHTLKTLIFL